ncbi:hypothetical protein EXIGLDRAFT_774920 [Exidia glandulosa HHB12029]|uniref:F-box domain-containing protein n=1 Tax=Exidia glandulosa HHB12029 TaxID=1314781 RepID=A0A165E610_EXIGL|nr:hypothetical protein EXIGLDRAFT_774920 [Exidia glandulosa HHB12029]
MKPSPPNLNSLRETIDAALDKWCKSALALVAPPSKPPTLSELMNEVHTTALSKLASFIRRVNDRSTLPVEVICAFLERLEFADVIRVAQTCKHWRDAALGNAVLWSHIRTSNPVQLIAMLERSAEAPLDVEIRLNPDVRGSMAQHFQSMDPMQLAMFAQGRGSRRLAPDDVSHYLAEKFVALLLPHMHRVRRLSILNLWGSNAIAKVLRTPAPELEYLRLTHTTPAFAGEVVFPPDLFDGQCAKLREVVTDSADIYIVKCKTLAQLDRLQFCASGAQFLEDDFLTRTAHLREIAATLYALEEMEQPPLDDLIQGYFLPPQDVRRLTLVDGRIVVESAEETPRVRDLGSPMMSEYPEFRNYVTNAILTSSKSLIALTLYDEFWSLVEAIPSFPRVTQLTVLIPNYRMARSRLGPFTRNAHVPRFPKLQELCIGKGPSPPDMQHEMAHNAAGARPRPLPAGFHDPPAVSPSDIAKLLHSMDARPSFVLREAVLKKGENDRADLEHLATKVIAFWLCDPAPTSEGLKRARVDLLGPDVDVLYERWW